MHTLRGKQFEVTHGSCVPNGDKEEFECEIPDDAAEKIQTVKDAIDFISSNS